MSQMKEEVTERGEVVERRKQEMFLDLLCKD